ncbi:hypothetical protein [Dictyobacter aurantiacus]|uniref:Uncharacterized protein n=1 Tax=Dictyobacter aurantiacus TaxID=1936993 RepID=A0A401ZRK2_9CHLR|nr:hypothetical protein [Dictyobacter aurantiacus]GCE09548.1 hypothetical protein KDAU_68770 [Dictyobacter aurantiacus]
MALPVFSLESFTAVGQVPFLEEHQLAYANEGIRNSARNALIAAGLFGVVGGIASGLVCGFTFG